MERKEGIKNQIRVFVGMPNKVNDCRKLIRCGCSGQWDILGYSMVRRKVIEEGYKKDIVISELQN